MAELEVQFQIPALTLQHTDLFQVFRIGLIWHMTHQTLAYVRSFLITILNEVTYGP